MHFIKAAKLKIDFSDDIMESFLIDTEPFGITYQVVPWALPSSIIDK